MRTNQQVIHIVAMCTCAASPLMHPSLRSSCCHFINIVIKAQIQCNCHCSVQSSSAVHFHISPPAVPTLHGHDRSPHVLHCSLCVLSKRCLVLRCIFETRCKMHTPSNFNIWCLCPYFIGLLPVLISWPFDRFINIFILILLGIPVCF